MLVGRFMFEGGYGPSFSSFCKLKRNFSNKMIEFCFKKILVINYFNETCAIKPVFCIV